MTKTIWKFEATIGGVITLPVGAQMLDIQVQHGVPMIWALVDPDAAKADMHVSIYGTGHHLPDDPGRYIGTFQVQGGNLVFHAFAAPCHHMRGIRYETDL